MNNQTPTLTIPQPPTFTPNPIPYPIQPETPPSPEPGYSTPYSQLSDCCKKAYAKGYHDGYLQAQEDPSQPTFPCIPDAPAEMLIDDQWIQGKIVKGYRFADGFVTIETPTGERYSCGQARTELYRPL